ncbi:MAG: hypothetical protein P8K08_20015 [Fuerstiella sp.]|nr:hypothetical protein [Fuerstiella sp.]
MSHAAFIGSVSQPRRRFFLRAGAVPLIWPVLAVLLYCSICSRASAQQLDSVFPVSAQAGTSTSIVFAGSGLENLSSARCNSPGLIFRKTKDNAFLVDVAADTLPGLYDVQTIGSNGVSSVRTFCVTRQPHIVEQEPTEPQTIQSVALNCVISGRITKGDVDSYRFRATKGDRLIIECWADRVDSSLRAMLELFDNDGRRLAVNRGFFGVDPVITYAIPADGDYIVKLHDLVYSGGDSHFYRLDVGTGPRVVFSVPPVVERGRTTDVTLYGWNLHTSESNAARETGAGRVQTASSGPPLKGVQAGRPLSYESTIVPVTAPASPTTLRVLRSPASLAVAGFPHDFGRADVPIQISVSDIPVVLEYDNHSSRTAQVIEVPTEVAGQLTRGNERDWYAIDARSGEVLYFEAFGQRIDSPVDLDISILDARGEVELAAFHDDVDNIGGLRFPSSHLDPAGRWVAPADGRYMVTIRNLIGSIAGDPRRVYRLSVRREEPDADLVAIAGQSASPVGVNVPRGGRAVVDVMAFRRRGMNRSLRVSARNLPPGVTCSDIRLGPNVTNAPLVLTADAGADTVITTLDLLCHVDAGAAAIGRPLQYGTMIRSGLPTGSGRLMDELPVAVAGNARLRITADGHEPRQHQLYGELKVRHSPGGILDVAVRVDRIAAEDKVSISLVGVGLPPLIVNQTATIPAGRDKGYISFYLPHSLPVGTYSLALRADTKFPISGTDKMEDVTVYSNTVTFKVHPPAFRIDLDLTAPRKIKRGEIVKVGYAARRMNGFIGKIHTELAAPGTVTDVGRLRGRGVSSTGQAESGTIQIIANEDAELGMHPFLRLYGVGVLEDEALYHGSCFLPMEIVE